MNLFKLRIIICYFVPILKGVQNFLVDATNDFNWYIATFRGVCVSKSKWKKGYEFMILNEEN